MTTSLDEFENPEAVIWEGQPTSCRMLSSADLFFVPVSLLFVLGSVLLLTAPGSRAAPLLVIGWSAMSMYFLVGRFLVKYLSKKATRFQLTNYRALVIKRGKVVRSQQVIGMKVNITESLSRKYATVSFDSNLTENLLGLSVFAKQAWLSENTGLDFLNAFNGNQDRVRFFDLPLQDANIVASLVSQIASS